MSQEWDIAITPIKDGRDTVGMRFPSAVGRTLIEREMTRTKVRITTDGILLVPYAPNGDEHRQRQPAVDLPDWT